MNKRSKLSYLVCLVVLMAPLPAFASNPHSTPGLDPSSLTGLAAMGYMGYQTFKMSSSKKR